MTSDTTTVSLFDRVGGTPFFERLVGAFYDGVEQDEVLAPLYPDFPDFSGARHRLTLFLVQYWGGPTTYNEERGHPRLRMRHFPFHVGAARARPLAAPHGGGRRARPVPTDQQDIAAELIGYFVPSAEHLRNDTGLPITSSNFNRG